MAFWREGRWERRVTYLANNKEVYDAEVFAILRAVSSSAREASRGGLTPFSQADISRVQHDRCGPVQALGKTVLATVDELHERVTV